MRIELASALLGGFKRGDANAFVGGRVVHGVERCLEIDEGGRHLSPVAELQRPFSEAASGDYGDGIGGAAIDLDEGYEALALRGAGLGDPQPLAAEHGKANSQNLSGAEMAVRQLGLMKEVVKGLHGKIIRASKEIDRSWPGLRYCCREPGEGVEEIVSVLWTHFALGFSALLPLVNPMGTALVILGLVGILPAAEYKTLARKIAINMTLFLAVVELVGSYVLEFFGVSLSIVQFAGGIVVAAIGWSMLNQEDVNSAKKDADAQMAGHGVTRDDESRAFYPLTFPVTAGPGCIVVMLTLSAHASERTLSQNVIAHVGLMLAVVALAALVYVCYSYAPQIARAVSPSTAHGVLRVIAFILLCIGAQIAWNGLEAMIKPLMATHT